MRRNSNRQNGFSLMEILLVVAMLLIVMAVVVGAITGVQKRNFTEQQRVDITQNGRAFLDQMARDMHNLGYPNALMQSSTTPSYSSTTLAWKGLVGASATDLEFEGDMDGSGQVTTVRYHLQSNGGTCPCTMERSAMYRTSGDATTQTPQYSAQVDNVVNSAGGASAWTISGTMPTGTANDTYYSNYKNDPLFQYFDKNGNAISVPTDLSSGFNTSTAATVRTVVVTLNVLAPYVDRDTNVRPAVTMRATIQLPNLQ